MTAFILSMMFTLPAEPVIDEVVLSLDDVTYYETFGSDQ
jgi:hypothetical protein